MKLIRVLLIIIIILFAMPRVVHANDVGNVYFYSEDEGCEYDEKTIDLEFEGNFSTEEKAFMLLDNLFTNSDNFDTFVPEGTKLIWVSFFDGNLIINVSQDGEKCGGTTFQRYFVNQIVKTSYSLDEIRSIMVYIEGESSELSEGYDFNYFNR